MNKIYRWGIIGCGKVTEIKSGPAFQKVEGFELRAVMRRDIKKAEDFAKRHNVPKFYGNADELIRDPEIDAVYIATPPDSHYAYAKKVLKSGKICCIEKPMTPQYKESEALMCEFLEKNIPLFVSYYRRSLPRFKIVKSWVEQNKIGNIRHVNWHFSKPTNAMDVSGEYNWRTNKDIAYGGYFDDLASHGIDLLTYILGNIDDATGIAVNQQGLYTSMDSISGSWLHKTGVTGTGSWNFGTNKREDIVHIYGDKGKIIFSVFDDVTVEFENESEKESLFVENPENIQFYHVQNMKNHLYGITKHPSTGQTAAHTTWVLNKILGK